MKCAADPSQTNRYIREQVSERVNIVRITVQAIDAHVLLDKFGFTLEQVQEFLDCVKYQYESVTQGFLSLDDIFDTLIKEHGLDLRFNFKRKLVTKWDVG